MIVAILSTVALLLYDGAERSSMVVIGGTEVTSLRSIFLLLERPQAV